MFVEVKFIFLYVFLCLGVICMCDLRMDVLVEKISEIINVVTERYMDRVREVTLPHSIETGFRWLDLSRAGFFVKLAFGRKYVHLLWRRPDSVTNVRGVLVPCANYIKLEKSEFERILRELGVV